MTLAEEVEYLQRYVDIQKMRFGDRLRISIEIPADVMDAQVPSLLLQPLVENAIKHGVGTRVAGGEIRVAGVRKQGNVCLSVYNDGPGFPHDWQTSQSGVGLSNLRTRLQILHGDAAALEMRREASGVEVIVTMPLRVAGVIRALVVDDEELARRNLTALLSADPDIGAVEECGSGVEAVEVMRRWKPDLVFLDVQMPECGGFDVLEMSGADLPRAVVFVTAHDEYALRAFEAGALDYLMKPFTDARFVRALNRAKDKLAHYAPSSTPATKRLVVRSPGQLLFLNATDIDFIEAASYYACLHVGSATHIIRRTLSDLERDLGGDRFIRIHRSIIVNLDRVQGLQMQAGGEYDVVLKSGTRLRLSRRFRKRLEERMESVLTL